MHRVRLLASVLAFSASMLVPLAHAASPDAVISQVYAGGGNAGASYANDFVELFNRGGTSVDLTGWTIQYASAASASWQATALAGSLAPGRHYLVQLASTAAVGAALPTPDATGTTNLAASGGKVALVRSATALDVWRIGGQLRVCRGRRPRRLRIGCGLRRHGCCPGARLDDGRRACERRLYRHRRQLGRLRRAGARAEELCGRGECVLRRTGSARRRRPGRRGRPRRPAGALGGARANQHHLRPGTSPGARRARSRNASRSSATTVRGIRSPSIARPSRRVTSRSASGRPPRPAPNSATGLGSGLVPIPVAPAADLVIGTAQAATGSSGDVWPATVGFASPLPAVASGRYAATVTFTAIPR